MKTRLITSAVGLAVLAAVMFLYETIVFDLIVAAICLIAIHELYAAFQFEKASYIYGGFAVFTTIVMLSNYLWVRRLFLPTAYLFALYLAICVIRNSKSLNYAKLAGMTMFSAVVVLCFYSLIYLKQLLPMATYGFDAIYFVFLILCIAWGGDSAAYFAGRYFGKHKLAPYVSPHKTVEGAVGGVLGSMLLAVIATAIYSTVQGRLMGIIASHNGLHVYLVIMLLAGIGSVLGILGDLFASVVKRQCGIKDYGTIFPGHGGILDRFDSVMFIAPFVAIIVTLAFYNL